jgi:hypothetical protein
VGTNLKLGLAQGYLQLGSEDYYFSSARIYAGLENDLDVVVLDLLRQYG